MTIATQIITAVASSQYGGCTITLTHLAPFIRDSKNVYLEKYRNRGLTMKYGIGSIVIMKKAHPCGTNLWEIVRLGVDIKLKCVNCGRTIMMDRLEFEKKLKKVVENEK